MRQEQPMIMRQDSRYAQSRRKNARSPLLKKRIMVKKMEFYLSWPVLLVSFCYAIIIMGFWFSGYVDKIVPYVTDKYHATLRNTGFQVNKVIIQGCKKTEKKILNKAIDINIGDSLALHDLELIKDRLQQIDWIKDCIVYRQLPDQIFIKIIERQPIAIWHNQKKLYLIDDVGVAIAINSSKEYAHLPHIDGLDAQKKITNLLNIIENFTLVRENISTFVRVRKRRWDLILTNNIRVKLPEENQDNESIVKALKILTDIITNKVTKNHNIAQIDLRLDGRYFIQKNRT